MRDPSRTADQALGSGSPSSPSSGGGGDTPELETN
jgi:hypothetical protein